MATLSEVARKQGLRYYANRVEEMSELSATASFSGKVSMHLGLITEFWQRFLEVYSRTFNPAEGCSDLVLKLTASWCKTTAETGTATAASTPTDTGNSATPPDASAEQGLNDLERAFRMVMDKRGLANLSDVLNALSFSRRGSARVGS